MKTPKTLVALGSCFLLGILLIIPTPALAAGIITLDGSFGDWSGQPCIGDPVGDASSDSNDLTNFCFVSDQTDEIAFFFIERLKDTNKPLNFTIFLDINDDGDYTDAVDRLIRGNYNANQNNTKVDVDLYDGQDVFLKEIAKGVDWGENGRNGASKVELGVSFADLGIAPGSTVAISMFTASTQGGAVDDGSLEVQWTPADALGWVLLGFLVVLASYKMVNKSRRKESHEDSS